MVINGGMEVFGNDIPVGWSTTTPDEVTQTTQEGRIHTGISAVNLTDGANLSQIVSVTPGCYYNLSFFAHAEGEEVAVIATVTFITPPDTETTGLQIVVNQEDIPNGAREFGYYRGITLQAPAGATTAEITFTVTATGNQSLDLDDVSFSVQ